MSTNPTAHANDSMFSRSDLILGDDAMRMLSQVRVAVFGIGGVGSWAAEALVRTGLRHITLIDADCVATSNINRQAPATVSTVGQPKTEAMRAHLLDVNPQAYIKTINGIYTAETAGDFNLEEFDYIIDAIDSLSDKALLLLNATAAVRPIVYSSMGAALKLDPALISVAEFWKVQGCPLAAALRSRFRRNATFPRRKFKCVFSPERMQNRKQAGSMAADSAMSFGKAAVNGSLCHITATFGLRLAALVISDIYSKSAIPPASQF